MLVTRQRGYTKRALTDGPLENQDKLKKWIHRCDTLLWLNKLCLTLIHLTKVAHELRTTRNNLRFFNFKMF